MKVNLNRVLSTGLRVLAAVVFLVAAVVFAEMPASTSVTSAYPSGSTPTPAPTPHQVQFSYFVYLPSVQVGPPPATPSYYVTNLSTTYDLGQTLGAEDLNTPGTQDHLLVLDFGRPKQSGSSYGTFLPFDVTYTFYSTSTIAAAVKDLARGYWIGTGSDTDSHNCCNGDPLSLFQGHGTAWANMMAIITSTIVTYAHQVDVVAGSDMETSFNLPFATTQWVQNLADATSTTTCTPQAQGVDGCLYNFGTATNVYPQDNTPCAQSITNQWVACDVWYISWGMTKAGTTVPFPRPLPEIYHTADSQLPYGTDATQWKNVAFYSVNATYNTRQYGSMYFVGSLTQFAQCGPTCYANGTPYANNTAAQGYLLLVSALSSNTVTRQSVRWSTDIGTQP